MQENRWRQTVRLDQMRPPIFRKDRHMKGNKVKPMSDETTVLRNQSQRMREVCVPSASPSNDAKVAILMFIFLGGGGGTPPKKRMSTRAGSPYVGSRCRMWAVQRQCTARQISGERKQ